MEPVPMVVISGPPGVGKTTTAWEVFSRAAEHDAWRH
jgi:broad-specificity NMP kinase